ncbi:hypothetical protein [Herbaspirillum rubrisubalbicans]|uniref:hypothetical protein n=1 Tax=Herbaspirillum rubrisubalbicans TaxID=80842 RepID=UPI0015C562C4|nr:hypothetical protein [Herbaspirillum rubrisubalbicans]NQE49505.1 hypothetical protein [Herbaspirillum rubrisubalbicans]
MTTPSSPDYEFIPDDFIRAVLYPFAMADYDGTEAIRLSAVPGSDVFDDLPIDLVNEALSAAQEAGLIEAVEERPGAIAMTPLGKKKFLLVRDDFFDDDALAELRDTLAALDLSALRRSSDYRQHQQSCTALAVYPTQPCPQTGRWLARRLEGRQCVIQEGESVPLPELDAHDAPVLWYLMKT